MVGVRLPKTDDVIRWADWLELAALTSADGNSSRGDLEGTLRLGGYLQNQERIEERCNAVFSELNDRSRSAAAAYPFSISPSIVSVQGPIENYPAYYFCLCLSYSGWSNKRGQGQLAARMFEDLSCLAANSFVGGEYACFASPRKGRPN